jgi:cellobiose-specific phosphotransferase system component IIA
MEQHAKNVVLSVLHVMMLVLYQVFRKVYNMVVMIHAQDALMDIFLM